jgi:hypothetical protein
MDFLRLASTFGRCSAGNDINAVERIPFREATMKHLVLAFAIAAVFTVPAPAAPPSDGRCAADFAVQGGPSDARYICAAAPLTCRTDWFVGGVDSATGRLSRYLCKPDVTEMSPMVGRTPAECRTGFHPRPPAVSNSEGYDCEAVRAIVTPACAPGFTAGPLKLGERELGWANSQAAASLRKLDKAQLTYACTRP